MKTYSRADVLAMSPAEFRSIVRSGEWQDSTHELGHGYAVTDVAVIPQRFAYDFLVFCYRNPLTCPVVDITDPGSPHPPKVAPGADVRTDLPRYRVYQDGAVVDEPTAVTGYWRDDLVTLLLGEASSFRWAWREANISFTSLGTFATNVPCIPSGPFKGNIAVSCKMFHSARELIRAVQISSRFPLFHGAPMHIGEPDAIGIQDINNPDVIALAGQSASGKFSKSGILAFWPCFGTVRAVLQQARLPLAIVDYPLHNFVTDRPAEELAAF